MMAVDTVERRVAYRNRKPSIAATVEPGQVMFVGAFHDDRSIEGVAFTFEKGVCACTPRYPRRTTGRLDDPARRKSPRARPERLRGDRLHPRPPECGARVRSPRIGRGVTGSPAVRLRPIRLRARTHPTRCVSRRLPGDKCAMPVSSRPFVHSILGLVFFASTARESDAAQTIVGLRRQSGGSCKVSQGAMTIGPIYMVDDEWRCDFHDVDRKGDVVTWKGECGFPHPFEHATVQATLVGHSLHVRFDGGEAALRERCRRGGTPSRVRSSMLAEGSRRPARTSSTVRSAGQRWSLHTNRHFADPMCGVAAVRRNSARRVAPVSSSSASASE